MIKLKNFYSKIEFLNLQYIQSRNLNYFIYKIFKQLKISNFEKIFLYLSKLQIKIFFKVTFLYLSYNFTYTIAMFLLGQIGENYDKIKFIKIGYII